MSDRPQNDPPTDSLTTLGEAERDAALRRFEALRPHLQHGVALKHTRRVSPYMVARRRRSARRTTLRSTGAR